MSNLNRTIVLCPGHFPGAAGAHNVAMGLDEHTEAARVVMLTAGILSQAGVDCRVITGTLRDKINQINIIRPALAVDLHFNADADHLDPEDYDNTRGDGCMVMHMPGDETRGRQAARFSAVMAGKLGERDLGGREGWYWGGSAPGAKPDAFLSQTTCPALIPEPGYIDNSAAVDRLLLGEQWQRVAGALAAAVIDFLEA